MTEDSFNRLQDIIDNAGGGFIKMVNSVYAIWAPYGGSSYVDVYSGIFIADSYAGDPLHLADTDTTDDKMKNENSCRALIYAGLGGNINIRGGYFIYNNTPNDNQFDIEIDSDGAFVVFGNLVKMLSRNVVLDDMDSMAYLQKTLRTVGVIKKLRDMGAKDGDTVVIGDIEFDFVD